MTSMTDSNGQAAISLVAQFDALVAQIEGEARRSEVALHPQLPEQDIEHLHQIMLASANALVHHQQMKQLHSAMLKVHRKIHQRHELALHHCRLLQSRIRTGGYGDQEMVEIVRGIQALLLRIRRENELVIRDRVKIKAEHDAFMASLPPRQVS